MSFQALFIIDIPEELLEGVGHFEIENFRAELEKIDL